MNTHHLNCFIAVAQHLSFTKAASHLHIVQSAVSHNIAELEKELGVKLFLRTKQSVTLTVSGEILFNEALKIVEMTRKAIAKTQQCSSGGSGRLSVGYVFVPIVARLSESFKNFRQKNPSIELHFNSYDSISIPRMVECNQLDIGFARHITINHERLAWKSLYRDALFLVCAKNHPLLKDTRKVEDFLTTEPLILMNRKFNPGMFDMAMKLCLNRKITPNIIDHPRDYHTVEVMVDLGMGVTILPGSWGNHMYNELEFVQIDGKDSTHEIGLVWNKENDNPAIELFLDEFRFLSE